MSPRARRLVWRTAVAVFLALALWPIWANRFPPMQDYPQHLFHAHLLGALRDPRFDYAQYYEIHLQPVYALFYLLTLAFSKLVPIEAAGKLALSVYPCLVAALALRLGQRLGKDVPPWGALLLFPFAANQQWFFGNIEFFLSVPLLFLALLDLEDLLAPGLDASGAARPTLRSLLRQAAWQIALFAAHPLTFLAFVAIAAFEILVRRRRIDRPWRRIAVPAGVAALLLAFLALQSSLARGAAIPADPRFGWISPRMSLEYFAMMFTGMLPLDAKVAFDVALWSAAGLILLACAWRQRRSAPGTGCPPVYLLLVALTFAATLLLPFQKGTFSFINVRIASIVYFLLALVAAHVRISGWTAAGVVLLAATCTLRSNAKQARISAEVEEIAPVVEQIPPKSRILPLVFDNTSPELDPKWFHPHLLDATYYHVLVGGGFDPYLIRSPIHPVDFRPGARRPAPGEFWPTAFEWPAHGADYDYFLVRDPPPGFARTMDLKSTLVAGNGRWQLYRRRSEP